MAGTARSRRIEAAPLLKKRELEAGPGNGPFHKSSFLLYLLFVPTFLILMLILLGLQQYKQLKILVSPNPQAIDYVPESKEAEDSLINLIKAFVSKSGADTLALTGVDLNHLVNASNTIHALGWKYHLDLEDTLALARTSVPASEMTGPAGKMIRFMRVKGYLNSQVRVYPALDRGKLILVPVSAVMNGEAAPPTALTKQGELNPRDWVGDKDAFDRAMVRLDGVYIRGGKLLLIKKP